MREPDLRYILVRERDHREDRKDRKDRKDDTEDKADDEAEKDAKNDKNKNENENDGSSTGAIRGFTSLMPAYEEGQPVVYCYEIHLKPELHGYGCASLPPLPSPLCGLRAAADMDRTGLAGLLLGFLYTIAYNLPPISKVMLTCFLSNERALRFYHKQDFSVDAIAPEARTLRGKTVVPDYTIMSKVVPR